MTHDAFCDVSVRCIHDTPSHAGRSRPTDRVFDTSTIHVQGGGWWWQPGKKQCLTPAKCWPTPRRHQPRKKRLRATSRRRRRKGNRPAPVRRKWSPVAKTKLFVSFDFDNDRKLRDFIIGQAKLPGSPFEVADHSLKEASREALWERKARAAIGRADKFVVMLGPRTRLARGVKKEVAMAVMLNKPRFQIIGYTDGSSKWAVAGGGRVYRWNWDNLEKLLRPPQRSLAEWFLGD